MHPRQEVGEVARKRHVCCVYLKVNKKIDAAAERVGQIAASDDPAREFGRVIGNLFLNKEKK